MVSKRLFTPQELFRGFMVCIKITFYNSVIFASIAMVINLFSRTSPGVTRAPNTNRTTVTFEFGTFFSSLAN